MDIGEKNLQNALLFYTGQVRDVVQIGGGATTTFLPINFRSYPTSLFNRCVIRILTGAAKDEFSTIDSTLANAVSLNTALSVAPSEGDLMAIYNYDLQAAQDVIINYRRSQITTLADGIDISGGVADVSDNYSRWTLYLNAQGAIDITIELSPDGGTNYFEISESPISFAGVGDKTFEMGYDATNIRITGSNANLVTAIIRGLY